MPIGLVAAGVGAAGAIGGAIISGNSADNAASTSAAAATAGQNQQAQQFAASQQFLQNGAANANTVQGAQHDASVGALTDAQGNAIAGQQAAIGQVGGLYNNSIDTINSGYASAKAANQPYLTAGASALNQLAGIYGLDTTDANGNTVKGTGTGGNVDPNATFYQSPDYQFQLSEGIKGTDAGAAARGMLDSGATRKAEIAYAGNLASSQFNTYASRLASLAGVGQQAVNTNAAGTTNYVNAITGANSGYGSAITGAANNIGNTYTGTANNIANANSGYATQYGNAQLGVGTNLANNATSYANNYATSVQNAANTQANAGLVGAANQSNAINGLAGTTAQYLNSNPNIFGSSYNAASGSGTPNYSSFADAAY